MFYMPIVRLEHYAQVCFVCIGTQICYADVNLSLVTDTPLCYGAKNVIYVAM